MYEVNHAHFIEAALGTKLDNRFPFPRPPVERQPPEPEESLIEEVAPTKKSLLTQILPDPGYFAAGGLAGVISRTATGMSYPDRVLHESWNMYKKSLLTFIAAPLDRLKVYLIANVGSPKDAITAVKTGDTKAAARQIGRPLVLAIKDLWAAGGMRSLFAGTTHVQLNTFLRVAN